MAHAYAIFTVPPGAGRGRESHDFPTGRSDSIGDRRPRSARRLCRRGATAAEVQSDRRVVASRTTACAGSGNGSDLRGRHARLCAGRHSTAWWRLWSSGRRHRGRCRRNLRRHRCFRSAGSASRAGRARAQGTVPRRERASRGRCAYHRDELENAKQHYRRAQQLAPKDPAPRVGLARVALAVPGLPPITPSLRRTRRCSRCFGTSTLRSGSTGPMARPRRARPGALDPGARG